MNEDPEKAISPVQATPPYPRVLMIVLGLVLCLVAVFSCYWTFFPILSMAEFLPTSMIIEEAISFSIAFNAFWIANLALLLGGFLLMMQRNRWATILILVGTIFHSIMLVELIAVMVYTLITVPASGDMVMGTAGELLKMTSYLPIVAMLIEFAMIVLLLRGPWRRHVGLRPRDLIFAAVAVLLMIADFHLVGLFITTQNG